MPDSESPQRPSNGGDLTMGFNEVGHKASSLSRCEVQPLSAMMTKQDSLGHPDKGSYICADISQASACT